MVTGRPAEDFLVFPGRGGGDFDDIDLNKIYLDDPLLLLSSFGAKTF